MFNFYIAGQLRATVLGPDGVLPIDVVPRGESIYSVGFTPRVPGLIIFSS